MIKAGSFPAIMAGSIPATIAGNSGRKLAQRLGRLVALMRIALYDLYPTNLGRRWQIHLAKCADN